MPGRLNGLYERGSCCTHTGHSPDLVKGVNKGVAVLFGLERPEHHSRRNIYMNSTQEGCEVCDGWMEWKNAVPRYRADGSI